MATAYIGPRYCTGGNYNNSPTCDPYDSYTWPDALRLDVGVYGDKYVWLNWDPEFLVGESITVTTFPIPHGITSINSVTLLFESIAIDGGAYLTCEMATYYPMSSYPSWDTSGSFSISDVTVANWHNETMVYTEVGPYDITGESTNVSINIYNQDGRVGIRNVKVLLDYEGTALAPVLMDAYIDSPTGYVPHKFYVDMRPYASGGPSNSGPFGLTEVAWSLSEIDGSTYESYEGLIPVTVYRPGTYTFDCTIKNWAGSSSVTKEVEILDWSSPYFEKWLGDDVSIDPIWGKSGYVNSGTLDYHDHVLGKGEWGDRSIVDVSTDLGGETVKSISMVEGKAILACENGTIYYSYRPFDYFGYCSNTGSYQGLYGFSGLDYDPDPEGTVGFAVGQENQGVAGFPTIARANGTSFTRLTLGEAGIEYESDGKVLFLTNENSDVGGNKVTIEDPSSEAEVTVETTGSGSFTIGTFICPSHTFSQHGNGNQILLGDTCRVSFGLWISTTAGGGLDPRVYFSLYYTDDAGGAATLIDQGISPIGITSATLEKFEFDAAINTGHTFTSNQRLQLVLDIITTEGDTRTITYAMQGTEHASYFSVPTNMLGGLNDVKCISSTNAWACGWADWPDYKGYVLHWDNVSWKPVGVPLDINRVKFVSMSFVDADHAWFLGTLYDDDVYTNEVRPIVLKYDNGAWEEETLPTFTTLGTYAARKIYMSTVSDGWIQASAPLDRLNILFHYSGNQWNRVETGIDPLPNDTTDWTWLNMDFRNREHGVMVLKSFGDVPRFYEIKSNRFLETPETGASDNATSACKVIDQDNIICGGQDIIVRLSIDKEEDDPGRIYVLFPAFG